VLFPQTARGRPIEEVDTVFPKNAATLGQVLLVLLTLLSAGFASAAVEDEIRARLQPHGDVCVMGESCAAGLSSGAAASGGPRTPDVIYQTYCFACHTTGANNAPVLGNVEQWAPRIAKGIDMLYESAITGFNNGAMPPKGLCMDCTNEEIQATVDHIVGQSQ
jgi:cytochrome c5